MSENTEEQVCPQCNKEYTRKSYYLKHIENCGKSKEKKVKTIDIDNIKSDKDECIIEKKPPKKTLIKVNTFSNLVNSSNKNYIIDDCIKNKKNLGQYFTISNMLQNFVFEKVKYKSNLLLEPSFGAGHLLKKFKEYDNNYPMVCYELDSRIKPVITYNEYQTLIYADFTIQKITKKFKTIIGNPPYVKQKTGNLYIKFIELCYNYLDDDGELIFIVPSDFIKMTNASSIITKMLENGCFTDFLFPNDENLFENASIDILVFRYEKGLKGQKTIVNGKEMFCNVNKGIITFSDTEINGISIDSIFNVYVGLVSGRDEIYKVSFGNIDILNDKDKVEKYIFTESFPTNNTEIDKHLELHKEELLTRKIKKFSEKNWFEWGAPRNLSSIKKYWGKQCIYIRTMTRLKANKEVSFISNVQYFGGSLLCLVPKNDMSQIELEKIIQYINSPIFQKDYIYAGRFKIGHKQISSAIIELN